MSLICSKIKVGDEVFKISDHAFSVKDCVERVTVTLSTGKQIKTTGGHWNYTVREMNSHDWFQTRIEALEALRERQCVLKDRYETLSKNAKSNIDSIDLMIESEMKK